MAATHDNNSDETEELFPMMPEKSRKSNGLLTNFPRSLSKNSTITCSEGSSSHRGVVKSKKDSLTHGLQNADVHNKECPTSSYVTFISSLAKKWTQAEVAYYQHQQDPTASSYSPLISHETGFTPPLWHLKDACKEYERRFLGQRSFKDGKLSNGQETEDSDSSRSLLERPFLLVATNVKDRWELPTSFDKRIGAKFMLIPGETKDTSALFIQRLAGSVHRDLDSFILAFFHEWVTANRLAGVVSQPLISGGKVYQPDQVVRPDKPDRNDVTLDKDDNNRLGKPFARLVVEIEHTHRNGLGLRDVGFLAMHSSYTRLFLGFKFWSKTAAGDFAAAAVLWGRNDEHQIEVRKAFDFGTKPLDWKSKVLFETQPGSSDDNMLLPPVTQWTRLKPKSPGYINLRAELQAMHEYDISTTIMSSELLESDDDDDDGRLTLPAKDILYKTSRRDSTDEFPYILDEPHAVRPAISDCHIDLRVLAWKANDILDV